MKNSIAIILTLISMSMARANSYAPTLTDIVVISDPVEGYSSGFYHNLLGDFFLLDAHATCSSVSITADKKVFCESEDRKLVAVGRLDSKLIKGTGDFGYYIHGYKVIFGSNVEIVKTKKNYAVRVK